MKIGDLIYKGEKIGDIPLNFKCEGDCENCKYADICGIDDYMNVEVELPLIIKAVDVANDNVNHPSHYETGKFECIDVMIEALGFEAVKDFCICNAFKYLYRHKRKNGLEDIKKAQWYINKYIELNDKEDEKCKS